VVIDGGNLACVRLLLVPRDRISHLPAGTLVHLTASDPAAPVGLPAWCHLTGHAYLGAVPAATPTYALRTISAPVTTDPAFPGAPPELAARTQARHGPLRERLSLPRPGSALSGPEFPEAAASALAAARVRLRLAARPLNAPTVVYLKVYIAESTLGSQQAGRRAP
jgi:tRNA 2-thiouridine synthesizing protein A